MMIFSIKLYDKSLANQLEFVDINLILAKTNLNCWSITYFTIRNKIFQKKLSYFTVRLTFCMSDPFVWLCSFLSNAHCAPSPLLSFSVKVATVFRNSTFSAYTSVNSSSIWTKRDCSRLRKWWGKILDSTRKNVCFIPACIAIPTISIFLQIFPLHYKFRITVSLTCRYMQKSLRYLYKNVLPNFQSILRSNWFTQHKNTQLVLGTYIYLRSNCGIVAKIVSMGHLRMTTAEWQLYFLRTYLIFNK